MTALEENIAALGWFNRLSGEMRLGIIKNCWKRRGCPGRKEDAEAKKMRVCKKMQLI